MKNWKSIILIFIIFVLIWFLRFYLNFPEINSETINIVLTISSILFGFLAGFFISELWSRYSEIRSIQGARSSNGLNMIKYAEHFFGNEKFKESFLKLTERSSVVDEIVEWEEGHLELSYYRDIEKSFALIKDDNVKTNKNLRYFEKLLTAYDRYIETTVRLDTLGKERLFASEWVMMSILSLIIALSILFIDVSNLFFRIIVLTFPVIIMLAMKIIYDLDTLGWSKESVSLEPNQRIFDALGLKRFYLKRKRKFISSRIKDYRTENDLTPELKNLCADVAKLRKS